MTTIWKWLEIHMDLQWEHWWRCPLELRICRWIWDEMCRIMLSTSLISQKVFEINLYLSLRAGQFSTSIRIIQKLSDISEKLVGLQQLISQLESWFVIIEKCAALVGILLFSGEHFLKLCFKRQTEGPAYRPFVCHPKAVCHEGSVRHFVSVFKSSQAGWLCTIF